MQINPKECFNENGNIRRELMFAHRFHLMPSIYSCVSDDYDKDDLKFDMNKINYNFIKSLYPKSEVYSTTGRHIDDEVSCVTEERTKDEPPKYTRDGAYVLSNYKSTEYTIILDDIPAIITFDKSTVEVIYDADSNIDIEKFTDDFISHLPKVKDDEDNEHPAIYLVAYNADSGYYTMESEINSADIDISKNYNDDFKPIYDDIVNFLNSDERKSGLIVLNGDPGTGKTYLIRHLVTRCQNPYILIPPSIASSLASPEFITFLIENKDSVFILEDCEQIIKDRNFNEFSSAVSSVLNMSDGLMSDIFNGKFICTFNADISSIDEAILRKGRCFANYKFGKLSADKVKVLLNERGIELDEYEDMTLADIYNYEVKNVKSAKQTKKIGF